MTGRQKLLIIDDDAEYAESLARLMPARYDVKTAFTLRQATAKLTSYPFDCVVSDFVLAEDDGFDFLKIACALNPAPKVIFITAFATKEMAIALLNLGAHGLLEKPFAIAVLTELLEKNADDPKPSAWRLDPGPRIMTTPAGAFELTEVEFKVVSYMIGHAGRWVSREELIAQVWGRSSLSRNVLDTHLTNLKRKVPDLKDALKAVRGRGYLLEES